MAKVKGQQIPPEIQNKYHKIFNSRIDGVVSSKKRRVSSPSIKQRKNRQEFYRATIYWNAITEEEKANIYNVARNKSMRYFNYFVTEVYKKRMNNFISKYGFKIEENDCPYKEPVAIAVSNNNIYIADKYTGNIYVLNYNLDEVGLHTYPGENIQGLTWDGNSLWTVDGETGKIFSIINESTTKEYFFSNCNLKSIAWNGNTFWIYDKANKEIFNLLPDGNITEFKYNNIKKEITDLAWDGFRLWASFVTENTEKIDIQLDNYVKQQGNELNIIMEPLINDIYNLCRLSDIKGNIKKNIEITVENLNIQLNNIAIKDNYIWTISKDKRKIYKIKVVGDMQ